MSEIRVVQVQLMESGERGYLDGENLGYVQESLQEGFHLIAVTTRKLSKMEGTVKREIEYTLYHMVK
ncbi:MAG: hypothetical protein ABMB14_11485 [Myxococcota bacterium]